MAYTLDYPTDLAGSLSAHPHYLDTRARINCLIDRYLSIEILSDRLSDLPSQFTAPHQRPWEPIDWKGIHPSQIVGIDPDLFLKVIAGATEIEAPIRAYSKESRDYLQAVHPQMAYFMGGGYGEDGSTLTVGVWEKEERQHAPAFIKIYQQLTGERLHPKPNSVEGCHLSADPWADLHKHVLSRIATEWSAASVYLWLMAHSTGELQRAIGQPFQDEINHLAKFWGFSRWAFADSYHQKLKGSTQNLIVLLKHHQNERTDSTDLMDKTLKLENLTHAVELLFTLVRVMVRLRTWNQELTYSYLRHLLGQSPRLPSPDRLIPKLDCQQLGNG
ncbi:MAG: ferritin-like domain-containing protein [Kovacikia sp.]